MGTSKNAPPHLVMVSRNATRSPENPVARFLGSLAHRSPGSLASRFPRRTAMKFQGKHASRFQGNSANKSPSKIAAKFPGRTASRSPGKAVEVCQGRIALVFLFRSKLLGKSVVVAVIINRESSYYLFR